jgi:hypothetical protein
MNTVIVSVAYPAEIIESFTLIPEKTIYPWVSDTRLETSMKTGLFLILLSSLAFNALAEEVKGIDYCHDAKVSQEWLKMITDYPTDPCYLEIGRVT